MEGQMAYDHWWRPRNNIVYPLRYKLQSYDCQPTVWVPYYTYMADRVSQSRYGNPLHRPPSTFQQLGWPYLYNHHIVSRIRRIRCEVSSHAYPAQMPHTGYSPAPNKKRFERYRAQCDFQPLSY